MSAFLLPDRFARVAGAIYAQAEPGTSLDDVVKPEFWALVSSRMKVGDEVVAMAQIPGTEGGGFAARLEVVSANGKTADVSLMSFCTLAEAIRCPGSQDGDR